MAEPFFPLTALSEAQRAQAVERFTIIRPALEEGWLDSSIQEFFNKLVRFLRQKSWFLSDKTTSPPVSMALRDSIGC